MYPQMLDPSVIMYPEPINLPPQKKSRKFAILLIVFVIGLVTLIVLNQLNIINTSSSTSTGTSSGSSSGTASGTASGSSSGTASGSSSGTASGSSSGTASGTSSGLSLITSEDAIPEHPGTIGTVQVDETTGETYYGGIWSGEDGVDTDLILAQLEEQAENPNPVRDCIKRADNSIRSNVGHVDSEYKSNNPRIVDVFDAEEYSIDEVLEYAIDGGYQFVLYRWLYRDDGVSLLHKYIVYDEQTTIGDFVNGGQGGGYQNYNINDPIVTYSTALYTIVEDCEYE